MKNYLVIALDSNKVFIDQKRFSAFDINHAYQKGKLEFPKANYLDVGIDK